jgi:cytochrome oxidase Cu insertion factor (SCO1/SenC/PrrC family)
MNSGLNTGNPLLLSAFRSALLHQGLIALLVLAVLALALVSLRESQIPIPGRAGKTETGTTQTGTTQTGTTETGTTETSTTETSTTETSTAQTAAPAPDAGGARWPGRPAAAPGVTMRVLARRLAASRAAGRAAEPSWRMLLRVGFGLLWIFDGLLQAQPAMVVGLPSQVIKPGAESSPLWVQHLTNWAGTSWSYHPVQAAAAAVWIQIGIGCWMVAARRGRWSQLAALAGVAWGLVVWVFGEAFGEILAPGLTWLFGAPGAALLYSAAGALIALPERHWRAPWLGRAVLAVIGVFFAGMAVLQAWPGRGFWQGQLHSGPGTLTGMIQDMARTPQPAFLAGLVRGFGSFTAAHGFGVNLFAVVALAAIGVALLTGRPGLTRLAVIAAVLLCLADWVLIEDLGFFGGIGTDPNSMVPMALLVVAGYLAFTAVRAPAPAPAAAAAAVTTEVAPRRPLLRRLGTALTTLDARTVIAAWALGLTLLGAFPLAAAAADRSADPVLAKALDGSPAVLNFPAKDFSLTDQHGRAVTLASLRGKVVLLTFLDPVCTTDCPLIAQEFRAADQLLGARRKNVELVAVTSNPVYHSAADTLAFSRQEGMAQLPNWKFLSGPLPVLKQVWHNYYFTAEVVPAGGMILHPDIAYVIDPSGRARAELNFDPGPGTSATESSFAAELVSAATAAMKPS